MRHESGPVLPRMATLDQRDRHPEVMDQPGLDVRLHRQALDSLQLINRLSRTALGLWKPICELAREPTCPRPLRILDIASGGGDVALGMARLAANAGVSVEVEGCDVSPTAVLYAQSLAAQLNFDNVSFRQRDVLCEPLPAGFDVITCSLFMHHLAEGEAGRLLSKMSAGAGRMVVISDLRRTRTGYLLAQAVGRVLSRSPVVRVDAPLSVAAAFSVEEFSKLARDSGMTEARIERRWPQRFLLTWRRPDA